MRRRADADEIDCEIAELAAERDQFKDIAQRLQADFENYRKRAHVPARRRSRPRHRRASPRRCCRCSTPPRRPTSSTPTRSGRCSTCCSASCASRASSRSTCSISRSIPNLADAVAHEAGDGGEVVVAEVLRSGYPGTAARCVRRWCAARRTETPGRAT